MSTTTNHYLSNDDAGREEAERLFIEQYGGDNQRERYEVGLLPEQELLAAVRFELFKPLAGFSRWEKLEAGDVRHERKCSGGTIAFTTQRPSDLSHDEWAVYKKITNVVYQANNDPKGAIRLLGVVAISELVEHIGRCSMCGEEVFGRAASVRIVWAGRPLSREYTLEEP